MVPGVWLTIINTQGQGETQTYFYMILVNWKLLGKDHIQKVAKLKNPKRIYYN